MQIATIDAKLVLCKKESQDQFSEAVSNEVLICAQLQIIFHLILPIDIMHSSSSLEHAVLINVLMLSLKKTVGI